MIQYLHQRLAHLKNARRNWLSLFLGMLSSLAFAPFFAAPLLWLSLSGLFLVILTAKNNKRAFFEGWLWGFGHFLTSNYWIGSSFLIEADRFAWMIPFILGGLASYLALFPAFASFLTSLFRKWNLAALWFIFAIAWTAAEWLRGHLLTGYPWNLMAYVWGFSPYAMQNAAYVGSWGLGFLTILLASAPVLAKTFGRASASIAISAILALILLPGLRIQDQLPGDTRVRLVQPGISQLERVKGGLEYQHLDLLLRLSTEQPYDKDLKAVIWPEAAVDFLLERHPDARAAIAKAAPPDGYVLTGTVRADATESKVTHIWNSLLAIDPKGNIAAYFDKAHLVPLGEYVPGRSIFPFINKLTPGQLDFSSGQGPMTIFLPGLPSFSPSICYEAIFPGDVIDHRNRPLWLLNVTNDGWFGTTIGPYQHFTSARFRAVEEGLPLIRVANTGISAVIDPFGRIVASMDLGERGTIDSFIPAALVPTPYRSFLSTLLSLW